MSSDETGAADSIARREALGNATNVVRQMLQSGPRQTPLELFTSPVARSGPISDYDRSVVQAMLTLGLVDIAFGGSLTARRRINVLPVDGSTIHIVTDFPPTRLTRMDDQRRAWPYADEAETTVKDLSLVLNQLGPGARVLDMCTGPGSIAISIKKLRPDLDVSGVDDHDGSIELAKLNTVLNGFPEDAIHWYCGDLFAALPDSRPFDLIVADPLFAPSPEGVYSQGGAGRHGDMLTKRILTSVSQYLNPKDGMVYMLSYSLGPKESTENLAISKHVPDELNFTFQRAGDYVWRYEHRKVFPNPMRVQYMILRLGDPTNREAILDLPPEKQTETINKWTDWLDGLERVNNYPYLHYVKCIGVRR